MPFTLAELRHRITAFSWLEETAIAAVLGTRVSLTADRLRRIRDDASRRCAGAAHEDLPALRALGPARRTGRALASALAALLTERDGPELRSVLRRTLQYRMPAAAWTPAGTWASLWLLARAPRIVDTAGARWSARLFGSLYVPLLRMLARAQTRTLVLAPHIDGAVDLSFSEERHGYRISYQLASPLERDDLEDALDTLQEEKDGRALEDSPGLTIALSNLVPGLCLDQPDARSLLLRELRGLVHRMRKAELPLFIAAERTTHLDLVLDLIADLVAAPEAQGWNGLGVTIEAQDRRAVATVDWVIELARQSGMRLAVRLVRGDEGEAERAAHPGRFEPMALTNDETRYLSYLACAQILLDADATVQPAFLVTDAPTLAGVLEIAGARDGFVLERPYGVATSLFKPVVSRTGKPVCRVVAPVASGRDAARILTQRAAELAGRS